MLRLLAFWIGFFLAAPCSGSESFDYDDSTGPPRLAPWPAEYSNYQILPGSVSSNNKFAFIYPQRSVLDDPSFQPRLFLVQQKPFRIVSELPIQGARLAANAYGSYRVAWSLDASAVVFSVGSKWGPDSVFVVSLRSDSTTTMTDLIPKIREQVLPDYRKSGSPRYNDYRDFIFDDDDYTKFGPGAPVDVASHWTVTDRGTVDIKCICTTDPKHLDEKIWEVIYEGTWDIAAGKLVHSKLSRIPERELPRD